jgi:hypothetical protein
VAATSIVVVPCAYVIAARIHLPLQPAGGTTSGRLHDAVATQPLLAWQVLQLVHRIPMPSRHRSTYILLLHECSSSTGSAFLKLFCSTVLWDKAFLHLKVDAPVFQMSFFNVFQNVKNSDKNINVLFLKFF